LNPNRLNFSNATVDSLSTALLEVRSKTLALVEDLDEQQLMGKVLPTVNPLRWEMAHAAYFHETWVLRHLGAQEPVDKQSDALFDSIGIQHKDRWDLPLPSLQDTFAYMNEVLQRELELLNNIELDQRAKYFYLLALFHEDMHNESFVCTRQTLSYPKPDFILEKTSPKKITKEKYTNIAHEDIEVAGSSFMLGAERGNEFTFDNEKWAHKVELAAFKIAKYAVSNEQFLEFVEAGAYSNAKLWSEAGWQWREQENLQHPIYWEKQADGEWYVREFDQWRSIKLNHAVSHISWYEAEAFCNWAQRRLPSEAEWEFAASCHVDETMEYQNKNIFPGRDDWTGVHANLDYVRHGTARVDDYAESDSAMGCRQMFGNVWEWTSSTFEPYPGFSPDWYTELSRPLFSNTKVLRGGAWPTRSRMMRNTLRNYYGPHRNDVFSGFRTCAK